jgi:hypothetical protein
LPHTPQLLRSVWVLTQPLAHLVWPAGQEQLESVPPGQADPSAHLQLHLPAEQVLVESPVLTVQTLPQLPQFFGSVCRFLQPALQ